MLECPEAVGEVIPEDDHTGGDQECAVEEERSVFMLSGICHHGGYDALEFRGIAEQSVAVTLEMRDDQDDDRGIQKPADDVDGQELQRLCMRRFTPRLFEGPSPVPEKTVQDGQEKCQGQGRNQRPAQFVVKQIGQAKVDDRAAYADDAELDELAQARFLRDAAQEGSFL